MSEERDILTTRKAKMQSWQAAVGTYPNEFRRQDLALNVKWLHCAQIIRGLGNPRYTEPSPALQA